MQYKVLNKDGYAGLTVGSRVVPSGGVFDGREWTFGDDSLAAAIKSGRCEIVKGSEKKSNSDSPQLAGLKRGIANLKDDISKATAELSASKEECDRLKIELDSAQAELSDSKKEIEDLKEKLKKGK